MGFFSKLIKKVTDKFLDKSANKVADKIVNSTSRSNSNSSSSQSSSASYSEPVVKSKGLSDKSAFINAVVQRFGGEYEILKNVPVEAVDDSCAGKNYRPYDLCFKKGDEIAVAVMYTPHNRDNNMAYKGAKAACENVGVTFLNFYQHMPNEPSYVLDRIAQAL